MNDNDPARNSFDMYYRPLVEIIYFNVSVDNTPFFNQLAKKNKKHMKNLMKCQKTISIQQEIY